MHSVEGTMRNFYFQMKANILQRWDSSVQLNDKTKENPVFGQDAEVTGYSTAVRIEHVPRLIRLGSLMQRLYFKPTFLGAEHLIADKPAMYIGNHTIYGVLDSPMLIDYLFTHHKIAIVSLGDHLHFKIPVWRKLVRGMGAVDGTPEIARKIMQQGYSILIFPGGGREVAKRKGEEYQLIWKERFGFLKLAQEFGYDIAPFVALGGDDVYDLIFDANTLLETKWFNKILHISTFNQWLRRGEIIPAIPRNLIPKHIHFYFKFLPRQHLSKNLTMNQLNEYRDDLKEKIYFTLNELKQIRQENNREIS